MRYLILVTLILGLWMLLEEFIFTDRSEEGLDTLGKKWRDLGAKLHYVFGILAILIMAIYALRLIFNSYLGK